MSFSIQISFQGRPIFSGVIESAVELGRQQHNEPQSAILNVVRDQGYRGEADRLVMAPLAETRIGRHQLLLEDVDGGQQVKITNLSDKVPVEIVGSGTLTPSSVQIVPLPTQVVFASKHEIQIGDPVKPKTLKSLGLATLAPGQHLDRIKHAPLEKLKLEGQDTEQLIQAMQAAMDVFQSANSKAELFENAVRGACKLVGFDRAVVIILDRDEWIPNWSARTCQEGKQFQVSQTVLSHVQSEKQTFWDSGTAVTSQTLTNIDGVIAAPILNVDGEVVGALYGDCKRNPIRDGPEAITRLQARLMELLACGVASALARIENAERAINMRHQFEQYFSKKLAEELEENPNLIEGRDADVSVLFCDIRRFSRISEKIGTELTFKWINDVMEVLSGCVNRHDGVLVDYIGDELMAMWGAPKPQENHAQLACQAALEMLSRLPDVEQRWKSDIDEPLEVSIGINSGRVRAGNTGSNYKFKYSPLGTTVNLASRVEGATKYLRTSALVTGETARLVDETIPRRRLCSVKVINIEESVPLYEIGTSSLDESKMQDYEAALQAFEDCDFRTAARILTELLQTVPDDGPSLVLLSRSVNALVAGVSDDHPVWRLEGK